MSGIAKAFAGSLTSGGRFSVYGESDVVFPSDADYTPSNGDSGGYDVLVLIVSGSITATRKIILPLDKGRPWIVKNTTSQSITVIGASGTGVTITTGTTQFVYSDGTNFVSVGGGPVSLGGSLGGTTSAATVVQADGSGSTDDFGGSGTTFNVIAIESIFGSSTTRPILSASEGITTSNATPTNIASFTPPNNTGGDWSVTVFGIDLTGGPASGDHYRADFFFTAVRAGSAAPVLNPASPPATNVRSSTSIGGGTPAAAVSVVSNAVTAQVTGVAARTWHWGILIQNQRLT